MSLHCEGAERCHGNRWVSLGDDVTLNLCPHLQNNDCHVRHPLDDGFVIIIKAPTDRY